MIWQSLPTTPFENSNKMETGATPVLHRQARSSCVVRLHCSGLANQQRAEFSIRLAARTLCAWGATFLLAGAVHAATRFPNFQSLTSGPHQIRLLPGQRDFVFTMYGTPGDLDSLRQLVAAMREHGLGNGFDPGPAPRPSTKALFDYLATVGWPVMCYPGCADMQIKGGRCVLTREDETALAAMDNAGVFTAVQLGEWDMRQTG